MLDRGMEVPVRFGKLVAAAASCERPADREGILAIGAGVPCCTG